MKIDNEQAMMDALMIVKADGMLYLSKILQCLLAHNITILSCKHLHITPEQAAAVYQEHSGRYYFKVLVEYLTMEKSMVLAIKGREADIVMAKKNIRVIAKEEALRSQQDALLHFLQGMTVSEKMKSNIAETVNLFQTEYQKTFDGIHCSDPNAGQRELRIFFDETDLLAPSLNSDRTSETIRNKLNSRNAASCIKAPLEEVSHIYNIGHH